MNSRGLGECCRRSDGTPADPSEDKSDGFVCSQEVVMGSLRGGGGGGREEWKRWRKVDVVSGHFQAVKTFCSR